MSESKVTPGNFGGGMNPALRHAMEQGNVNIASSSRIVRVTVPGGPTYYGPAGTVEQAAPSPLGGIAFRMLYRETRAGRSGMFPIPGKPELEKCEAVSFGLGFIIETIDKPEWWDTIEEEAEKENKKVIV